MVALGIRGGRSEDWTATRACDHSAVLTSPSVDQGVRGVALHALTQARDQRGSLAAFEFTDLPFTPQRVFAVFDVPSESVRGAHAHRSCSQFLICLAGELSCLVDDGAARAEIRLAPREVALHVPPMIWTTHGSYTRDAILLVLASHPYDPADYIRDYEEFLALVAAPSARSTTPSSTR